MAATVGASKAYDLSGGALREDLEDIIYDISPMDTVFLTRISRLRAKSTLHEWLSDKLTAAALNAAVEGDAFSATARTLPTRLKNYTQISKKEYEVTGTAQAVDNAGMAKLMAYHAARAGKELKRDMEVSMLGTNAASAGTSVSPRVSASVSNWITTPDGGHIKLTNQTTASTSAISAGFANGAVTAGSSTAMVSADLNNMLSQAWSCGGETDTILCPAAVYNTISGFTSIATRFRNVNSRAQAEIIGAADVYVSAYGSHNIVLSRYIPAGAVYALDMKTWGIAYLRSFTTLPIAQVGDAVREGIVAEWTLVCKAPTGNTKVTAAA